jgi:hypothetical protein
MSAKTDKLRAAVDAMTPGEWLHGSWQYAVDGGFRWTKIAPESGRDDDASITVAGSDPAGDNAGNVIAGCGCCGSPNGKHADVAGICALRNHATALLDVVTAAQAYIAANDVPVMGDSYYIDRHEAHRALRLALARLENLP